MDKLSHEPESPDAPKKDGLRFVVDTFLLKILKSGGSVVAPKLFELVDLMERNLSSTKLLLLRRDLDEPGQERAIFDQRRPLCRVPDDIFGALHRCARLAVRGKETRSGPGNRLS